MKLYSTNRINALGLKGPEKTPEAIKEFIKSPIEHIQVDNNNIQESEKILYDKSKQIFQKDQKQIFIGGDHSITYPIFKAFQETKQNPFLIIFDAHIDCDYSNEEPTHEEWLRAIVEKGFSPENIILIGARKEWKVEREFLNKHKIKVFRDIYDFGTAADYITERANGQDVYLSIDIDALDPAFAPAVNYPEPAGLSSRDFFYLLRRILRIPTLDTIDITEAVPEKDKAYDNRTLRTIAKIIEETTQ